MVQFLLPALRLARRSGASSQSVDTLDRARGQAAHAVVRPAAARIDANDRDLTFDN